MASPPVQARAGDGTVSSVDKKALSERDICTKFITPALERAGWDKLLQVREEVSLTAGRVIVRGKLVTRATAKRADYVLYHKLHLPLAVIEAKDNAHGVGDGMQQGLQYAEMLDVPFTYSSNGDGFLEHDRTGAGGAVERGISLDAFPSPEDLWARYRAWKGIEAPQEAVVTQDHYIDGTGKAPGYYQVAAVNKAVEAIAQGQNRILLAPARALGPWSSKSPGLPERLKSSPTPGGVPRNPRLANRPPARWLRGPWPTN